MARRFRPSRWSFARAGFTLVELIAVLVVLSVLSAVVVARINTMTSARAPMAGQVVLRDLAFARERAMNTGVTHWVTVNTINQSLVVQAEQPPTFGYAGRITVTDPASGRPYQRFLNRDEFSGVRFSSAVYDSFTIGFTRFGRPINPLGAVITTDSTISIVGGPTITISGSSGGLSRSTP
jgi:prepilin-type N-terminal cleavage/methylation domain-containing protein